MSLNNKDVTTREKPGPIDVLVSVQAVIDAHTGYWRDEGWSGSWICEGCEARLTEAENRTHTAHQLWIRGYLQVP